MKRTGIIVVGCIMSGLFTLAFFMLLYFGLLMCSSNRSINDAISYYERDDSYVSFSATISNVEKVDEYYRVYLQYDNSSVGLEFVTYFELIPSNVNELQNNGFNIVASDSPYVFTVGRKTMYDGPSPLATNPIVEVREINGGKIYLDYATAKLNLLHLLASKI